MRILQQALRVYVESERLPAEIAFYETLQGTKCERRVDIAETGVSAAKVGGFLILAGTRGQLDAVRAVGAIFYVDALDEFVPWLRRNGAEILAGPRTVTGGRNATVRHADGLIVEYFEGRPPHSS
jgi:predicted enzyme related to lactoylglutathione lyase